MKIAAINGSTKPTNSTSALIIKQIESLLGEKVETHHATQLTKSETPPELIASILDSEVLLIVFPLFVDSLPAPLIEFLSRLEKAATEKPSAKKPSEEKTSRPNAAAPRVFAIVNSGFFEAKQNTLALEMVEHFANRVGASWGYGIAIGAGGMLSDMGSDWSKGPMSDAYQEMRNMVDAIHKNISRQNAFVQPSFPRFLYKLLADQGLRRMAKQNGVEDIRFRPY